MMKTIFYFIICKAKLCRFIVMHFCINRQQDVRATEIDKVDMYLSFRPGDIVRALVVCFLLSSIQFQPVLRIGLHIFLEDARFIFRSP